MLNPETRLSSSQEAGVQIHAHGIDAVLHHAVQRLSQALLRHIVLILPHTDGLGIDLDQLRKGSCKRRAMDTAERRDTSYCGNSAAASGEAE